MRPEACCLSFLRLRLAAGELRVRLRVRLLCQGLQAASGANSNRIQAQAVPVSTAEQEALSQSWLFFGLLSICL